MGKKKINIFKLILLKKRSDANNYIKLETQTIQIKQSTEMMIQKEQQMQQYRNSIRLLEAEVCHIVSLKKNCINTLMYILCM